MGLYRIKDIGSLMKLNTPIYMDNHATTPVDPRVLEGMLPFFTQKFGNAASRNHAFGWESEAAVDQAREQIAKLIGASSPREIVFTSGATESDNLAIKGIAESYKQKGNHIVTCVTEHKAVLDSCKVLEKHGYRITYLPVDRDGFVDLQRLQDAITDKTILISIMAANNEIGTQQPVEEIGALYVRSTAPRVRLSPTIDGGGHERGMRSGTLNVPGIVGLGKACEIAQKEMPEEAARLLGLRERLRKGLEAKLDEVFINGSLEHRLPNNLNMSFAYVEGESLLMGINDIAVSSGSACTSATLEPSYVLKALGVGEDLAHTSIRFGLGRFNTEEEVDYVTDKMVQVVTKLRELSPLYEMAKEGIDISKMKWQTA